MRIVIRPATAADAYAIKAIVRAAWLNPFDLDWPRFVVATWGPDTIGVGQVKPHRDGTRELASIAVVPEWQGQGVGGAIVRALLAREPGPIYLMCNAHRESYYRRFGFRRLGRAAMPAYFRRFVLLAPLIRLITLNRVRLIVMGRDA
jgi:N-acetylglutamate synthase-like GNAT family acetyltransferase